MKNLLIIGGFLLGSVVFLSCDKRKEFDCVAVAQDDCLCYEIYAPVCGCDNVTYSNDCYAECNGITDYVPGECK